jgi:hypothetical protein
MEHDQPLQTVKISETYCKTFQRHEDCRLRIRSITCALTRSRVRIFDRAHMNRAGRTHLASCPLQCSRARERNAKR